MTSWLCQRASGAGSQQRPISIQPRLATGAAAPAEFSAGSFRPLSVVWVTAFGRFDRTATEFRSMVVWSKTARKRFVRDGVDPNTTEEADANKIWYALEDVPPG